MERQLFTWEGWDQHDTMCFGFSDCTVVQSFGPYKPGDKLDWVTVDYENSVITVWQHATDEDTKPSWKGRLQIQVLPLNDDA